MSQECPTMEKGNTMTLYDTHRRSASSLMSIQWNMKKKGLKGRLAHEELEKAWEHFLKACNIIKESGLEY